jgi:hypothetical protein
MKTTIVFAYAFIFTLSIVIGYWLGQKSTPVPLPPIVQNTETFPLPGQEITEQINLLVVFVNRIDAASTGLQMIWMVAFNPDAPIKLLPVYPSATQDYEKDSELKSKFNLQKQEKQFILDQGFIQMLQAQELEWDGVIILDNRAMAYIIDTFGTIRLNDKILDRDQLAAYRFPGDDAKQSNLTYQTLFWREICWNILHSPEDIPKLNKDFNKHASVTFLAKISKQDWVALLASVKIPSCEFPTYFQNNP